MNSSPRWLISMTDMPLPCQSSISCAAFASTGSGSTAGPALKLNTRAIESLLVDLCVAAARRLRAGIRLAAAAVRFAVDRLAVAVTVAVRHVLRLLDRLHTRERFV